MFCPDCRCEYREEFTTCADCKIPLVAELPPESEPQYEHFVTVLRAHDDEQIAVAKSLLDASGIQCVALGEGVQDLFALGRFPAGYNPILGPVQIKVRAEDAETAIELLADLAAPPE